MTGKATEKTVLIGLDGGTFTIFDALIDEGVMPFLKEFLASGARADLLSVIPALTPPAWTSLMTGRNPGNHGVFDFFNTVEPGNPHLQFTTSKDIKSETIWSMASRNDLRVTCLNFPLMFPPPAINGHVVPGGWMPWRTLRLGCHPSDLYDKLKALPGFNARELAMDPKLEEKAIDGSRHEEYEDWIELHIRREQHWIEILRYLMESEPADLTAIMFDGVDKIQHLCWRFLDKSILGESPSPWEQRIRQLCLDYFNKLDRILADIVELSGPDANVVITSDHGFGPTDEIFHVNTWLQQQGYLTWVDEETAKQRHGEEIGIAKIARHTYQMDWENTKAYASTPSSSAIHIVIADDNGGPGVPKEDYFRFRDQLILDLRGFKDSSDNPPVVSEIWTREDAFAGEFQDHAPDLTLTIRNGGHVSIFPSDKLVQSRTEIKGSHRPEGIFIGRGPGIRPGVFGQLSIVDVTPLLLYMLDLPIPENFEGRFPSEVFEDNALAQKPVRYTGSTDAGSEDGFGAEEEFKLSPEDEATMVERLRALGYIE